MISRIRLNAYGQSATEVEGDLLTFAGKIDQMLSRESLPGEQVIEKNLDEPADSSFAFQGRLTLHPDVSASTTPLTEGA